MATPALVLGAACGESAIAPPETDPPPTPYLVSPRGTRVFGVTNIIIIPTIYAGGAQPIFTAEQLDEQYFGPDGTGGPMDDTYGLASRGRFALRGDVAPWVTTTVVSTTLSAPGVRARVRGGDHVIEAINAADAVVDYRKYDNDGPDGVADSGDDDGWVDGGVVIVNSEFDLKCNGGTGKGPHPHALVSSIAWLKTTADTVRTADIGASGRGIAVRGYTQLSAYDCLGTGVNYKIMSHELGHLLFALPDMYHAVAPAPPNQLWIGRRWVVGCWELMASGSSWSCGNGDPPETAYNSTFGAWARMTIGWDVPEVVSVTERGEHELRGLSRGGGTLKLPIAVGEYLLAEYREREMGDLGVPGPTGVLFFHVSDSLPFFPASTAARRYRVRLIEADDDSALVRIAIEGGNRGTADDAFGHKVTAFGSTHTQARTRTGQPLPFSIENITIDAARGRARFTVVPRVP